MEKNEKKIIVVGASAAGLRAAARAKRLMPDSRITVVDQEKIISYGACGLPYYVAGEIESPRPLRATAWGSLRDPEFFLQAKGLDVRIQTTAKSVNIEEKTIEIENDVDGSKETLRFDKLVLATGASPVMLPGIAKDHPRISVFKTVEDAVAWRQKLETGQMEKMAIIGSGFIGIELAEAFGGMWGVEVTLIEADNRVLPKMLDMEMSTLVLQHLQEQGINILTSSPVQAINDVEGGLEIVTDSKTIQTQYAIVAMGVKPRTELATQIGLKIGPSGGIVVDENLQTSHPDVYAAGDCIEVETAFGQKAVIPLGSLANKQGRAVGDQLAGKKTRFGKVAASACVKVFDYNVASTGVCETIALKAGIDVKCVWGTFGDIAHYHPDDKNIFLKLIYNAETLKVLGLQAVGLGEVVKRVDVLGNLILNNGIIEDILDLEFAYSPPYAPALDPLYVLGAAAQNQEDGVGAINPFASLKERVILDVRTKGEATNNPMEGSVNIPLEELRGRIDELENDKPICVVCAKGVRSAEVTRWLVEMGHKNVTYAGGGIFMMKK